MWDIQAFCLGLAARLCYRQSPQAGRPRLALLGNGVIAWVATNLASERRQPSRTTAATAARWRAGVRRSDDVSVAGIAGSEHDRPGRENRIVHRWSQSLRHGQVPRLRHRLQAPAEQALVVDVEA